MLARCLYFACTLLFLAKSVELFNIKTSGDFVETVTCNGHGMDFTLKDRLPIPRSGMWSLEVENHPECPGVTKTDVGGGHRFSVLYSDKDYCGVEPASWFTPNWVSYAQVTLILNDANGTKIADSVSCIYNTRFDSSLLTFKGDVMSENLRYGGSLEEEGADVESVVDSGKAVAMDFYDPEGRAVESNRRVKLGDPLYFRIHVSESKHVSKILPETCYFSSSSEPDEKLAFGQTLTFIRNNCFNDKNGLVKSFLQRMERNFNGTSYQLNFPAFYFTDYGRNLFVHCTILACIGDQKLCEPKQQCFASNRRRREVVSGPAVEDIYGLHQETPSRVTEFVLTKHLAIQDAGKTEKHTIGHEELIKMAPTTGTLFGVETVCVQGKHLLAMFAMGTVGLLVILVVFPFFRTKAYHGKCDENAIKRSEGVGSSAAFTESPFVMSF